LRSERPKKGLIAWDTTYATKEFISEKKPGKRMEGYLFGDLDRRGIAQKSSQRKLAGEAVMGRRTREGNFASWRGRPLAGIS